MTERRSTLLRLNNANFGDLARNAHDVSATFLAHNTQRRYESGLAVKMVARHEAKHAENNHFQANWGPRRYLTEFYSTVEQDEQRTILFTTNLLKQEFGEAALEKPMPVRDDLAPGDPGRKALIFGTGPAMKDVFIMTPYVSEIHLADFLPENIAEVRKWYFQDQDAFDWTQFVRYTLQCERKPEDPTSLFVPDEDVKLRELETRKKITKFIEGTDAKRTDPLDTQRIGGESPKGREEYDIVFSPYTADSATQHKSVWWKMMGNIISTVKPGGLFLTAALRNCREYPGGEDGEGNLIMFPGANINETHMSRRFWSLDFDRRSISVTTQRVTDGHGYDGIILAHARKLDVAA